MNYLEEIEMLIPGLQGWSSVEKCKSLFNLIVDNKIKKSVEIGVWGGRCSISMAMGHKALGAGICFGVDPYSAEASTEGTDEDVNKNWWSQVPYEQIYSGVLIQILAQELTKQLMILRMKSIEAHKLLRNDKLGLVVIDGNHSVEMASLDMQLWLPLIEVGGFALIDDLEWAGVAEAAKLLPMYGFKEVRLFDDPAGSQWGIFQKIGN